MGLMGGSSESPRICSKRPWGEIFGGAAPGAQTSPEQRITSSSKITSVIARLAEVSAPAGAAGRFVYLHPTPQSRGFFRAATSFRSAFAPIRARGSTASAGRCPPSSPAHTGTRWFGEMVATALGGGGGRCGVDVHPNQPRRSHHDANRHPYFHGRQRHGRAGAPADGNHTSREVRVAADAADAWQPQRIRARRAVGFVQQRRVLGKFQPVVWRRFVQQRRIWWLEQRWIGWRHQCGRCGGFRRSCFHVRFASRSHSRGRSGLGVIGRTQRKRDAIGYVAVGQCTAVGIESLGPHGVLIDERTRVNSGQPSRRCERSG